jgi:3,4-dihydroxy 2-butanone 4-phosphate synthase / GTP cyclohydrolase II
MIATIQEALQDLKAGKMIIVVDDPTRENEGDLIMLGEKVTPADMNFMIKEGRGVPFISVPEERLDQLGIPMMTKANTARLGTAMAETVDAIEGTTTGVSAGDRAKTVEVLCNPQALPGDLMRPGHMLVLRAEKGGILRRAGHTEASVDLCLLCDAKPVGVGVEIIGDDGEMLRLDGGLEAYAAKHGLKIITIEDLIAYRRRTETLVSRKAGPINFPTKYGNFKIYAYETEVEPEPFIAIVKGDITPEPTLVRVHSSCLTGDILGSLRCDCGDQLSAALQMIEAEGSGVVLYIAQEGRGIGIVNKLRAYELQDSGLDTVEANEALGFKPDQRDYGLGSQVLYDLGVRKMKLISNNPAKRAGLQGFGLEITETVPIITPTTEHSEKYIETKRDKMGHLIP